MSLHFVTLGVSTRCSACNSQLPIDGPMREVHCRRCKHPEHIEPATWAYVLRCAYEGVVRTTFAESFAFSYPEGGLPCPACSTKIELGELPTSYDGAIECPHCETPFDSYPAPPWLAAELPQLLQFYAAARETPLVESPPESGGDTDALPVALTCPNCNAVFTLSPLCERSVVCEKCQTEVLIPDEDWVRIRPLGKVRLWAFCYDADMDIKTGDEQLATPHRHGCASSEHLVAPPEHESSGIFGNGFEGDVDVLLSMGSEARISDANSTLDTRRSCPPPEPELGKAATVVGVRPWIWIGLGLFSGALCAFLIWWNAFRS